jgi:hypothetical protein
MSYNLSFAYIRTVLDVYGPSTRQHLAEELHYFDPDVLDRVLQWGRTNGSLTFNDDRYHLTELGRR